MIKQIMQMCKEELAFTQRSETDEFDIFRTQFCRLEIKANIIKTMCQTQHNAPGRWTVITRTHAKHTNTAR